MNLRPLHDRVVIKTLPQEEVTKSGIILPDASDKKSERGEVTAIGPGRLLDNGSFAPMSVKVGDKILFKGYHADEFEIEKEKFFFIEEKEIIAVIE